MVGKPAEAGTDVFAIDQGNSSATQMFTSGFPVDFATEKFYTTSGYNWGAASRLTAKAYLYLNTTAAEAVYSSHLHSIKWMDGVQVLDGILRLFHICGNATLVLMWWLMTGDGSHLVAQYLILGIKFLK